LTWRDILLSLDRRRKLARQSSQFDVEKVATYSLVESVVDGDMIPGRAKQLLSQRGKYVAILKGRIELGKFMSLPEDDFQKLIKEIKIDPLFKRLASPETKVIRPRRFPGTSLAKFKTIPLDPAITPSRDSYDLESFLAEEQDTTLIIKKLGVDRFKKYFLERDFDLTLEEIAQECHLTIEEVEKLNSFMDTFYLRAEEGRLAPPEGPQRIYYSTIASIEKEDEGFSIGFFLPEAVEGRYLIDFDRFQEMKKRGEFDGNELGRIKTLFDKLRLVNSRKTIIYRIIQSILELQRGFLDSGSSKDLKLLTQAFLSKTIGVDPSIISRAVSRKAIRTPQGREIALKTFFPTRKEMGKELIRQIIGREGTEIRNKIVKKPYSDGEIRRKLKEDYGVSVSRRSVSEWRMDLMIPSASERMRRCNTS